MKSNTLWFCTTCGSLTGCSSGSSLRCHQPWLRLLLLLLFMAIRL
jgi:hypothetical protein